MTRTPDAARLSAATMNDLTYLFNDSPEGWLTMTCDRCGVMRRVPMSGDFTRPLDDADAETIASAVWGKW